MPTLGGGSLAVRKQVRDFMYAIGEQSHQHLFPFEKEGDDDDAAVDGGFARLHAEGQADVCQRNDAAAEVDDPADEIGRARHHGCRNQVEDFADDRSLEGEDLAIEIEGEDLHPVLVVPDRFGRLGNYFCCLHQTAARSCASSCCPRVTRWAMSRMRARVPSPRIVAPEKLSMPWCSRDIDLMTV